jgi:hypothetical protein
VCRSRPLLHEQSQRRHVARRALHRVRSESQGVGEKLSEVVEVTRIGINRVRSALGKERR